MNYKTLNIFVYHQFSKIFLINESYLFSDGQTLNYNESLQDKFFLSKLDVHISKSEPSHF